MNIRHLLPLGRLIAKVDNDFNIDNSDWIPRVGAWTIDALAQLNCLPYCWYRKKVNVVNRIATCENILDSKNVRVYTNRGCLLKRIGDTLVDVFNNKIIETDNTFKTSATPWTQEEIAIFTGNDDIVDRLRVGHICHETHDKNFVLIDDNKIELNFDTDWIVVEYYGVAKYLDEELDEYVPYIYDNGLLLEALAWYVLFKILSRGYKHQVYSISGNNHGQYTNPYIMWNNLRQKAAISVKRDLRDPDKNEGWNNFFYNSTFLPRG